MLLPATSGRETPFSGHSLLNPCTRPSLSAWFPPVPVKAELSYGSSPFSSHPFSSPAAQEVGCMHDAFCEVVGAEAGQCPWAEQGICDSMAWKVQSRSTTQWTQEERWVHCAKSPCSHPKLLKAGSHLQKAWFPTLPHSKVPLPFPGPLTHQRFTQFLHTATAPHPQPNLHYHERIPHHRNAFNSPRYVSASLSLSIHTSTAKCWLI